MKKSVISFLLIAVFFGFGLYTLGAYTPTTQDEKLITNFSQKFEKSVKQNLDKLDIYLNLLDKVAAKYSSTKPNLVYICEQISTHLQTINFYEPNEGILAKTVGGSNILIYLTPYYSRYNDRVFWCWRDNFWEKCDNLDFLLEHPDDFEVKGIDFETFETIADLFAKDKYNVYAGIRLITNADPASFSNPIANWGIDDNNIYLSQKTIPWANISSARFLNRHFMKDDSQVFCREKLVEDADPDTFEVIDGVIAKDNNNLYRNHKIVATTEQIDLDSIEVIVSSYIKDKNAAYYIEGTLLACWNLCEIEGADLETLVPSPKWIQDKDYIYYYDPLIGLSKKDVDEVDEFEKLDKSSFKKNATHIFYKYWKEPLCTYDPNYEILWSYLKCQDMLFHRDKKIKEATSFDLKKDWGYLIDYADNSVYYIGRKLPQAHAPSFEYVEYIDTEWINGEFVDGKDNYHKYTQGTMVVE